MSKIDDITIMNAWMFPAVFADERNLKLTKQLIEICMNRKIESIQQASVEHHVKPRLNSHGTRFDVKFVGDKEIYIVELQLYREYLLERAEYYHALEKVASFRPGEPYSSLKKTVVIFICNFDFFGLNEGRYVYKSGLVDHPELNFESHSTTIFLNTKGITKDKLLCALLRLFETNQTSDEFTEKIKQAVEEVKRNDRKRESYMNYEEMVAWEAEHRALGIARGIAQKLAKDMAVDMAADMAVDMAADMAESEKQTICKNMLSENLDISLVAKVTGYSIDEILEMQKNM